MTHILAIDQGTTSSRAIVFDAQMQPVASAQEEFTQHFPASGWVEHEAEDIWGTVISTARAALEKAGVAAGDLASMQLEHAATTHDACYYTGRNYPREYAA